MLAFGPFCCAKLLNRNIARAKKFAFRKSASSICHLCHWGLSCPVGYVERGGLFGFTFDLLWGLVSQSMIINLTLFPDLVPVMVKFNKNQGPEKLTLHFSKRRN